MISHSKYSNGLDHLYGVKKHCKTCVDEMMQKVDNFINHHNTESHLFLANNNQLNNNIKICEESEQANINNNGKMMTMSVGSKLQVEEDNSKVDETLIQDAMSNYYFANDHKEGTLFLSSYIKFVYKT